MSETYPPLSCISLIISFTFSDPYRSGLENAFEDVFEPDLFIFYKLILQVYFITNVKANQTSQDNRFSSSYLRGCFSQLSILDVLIRQLHSELSS